MSTYSDLVKVEKDIYNMISSGNMNAKKLSKLFLKRAKLSAQFAYEQEQNEVTEIKVTKARGRKRVTVIDKLAKDLEKLMKKDSGYRKDIITGHDIGEKITELASYRKASEVCRDLGIQRLTRSHLTRFYKAVSRKGLEEILKYAKDQDITLCRAFFIGLNEAKFQTERQYTRFAISCINNKFLTAKKVHDAIVANALNYATEMERTCALNENVRIGVNALTASALEMSTVKDAQ